MVHQTLQMQHTKAAILLIAWCSIVQSIYGRNKSLNSRIIGGQYAPSSIAPYMCALRIYKSSSIVLGRRSASLCGCSILSNKWVLTAAHCTKGKSVYDAKVLVGTNNLKDSIDSNYDNARRYYDVDRWVRHHHYIPHKILNDIAVVKVMGEIEFNDRVQPIRISSSPIPAGARVQLTGWGKIDGGFGNVSNFLKTINMTIIAAKDCSKLIRNYFQQICVVKRFGQGACQGDSGSPLVWQNEVIGVASFIVNRCASGKPDVFVRISNYYDWIMEQISY